MELQQPPSLPHERPRADLHAACTQEVLGVNCSFLQRLASGGRVEPGLEARIRTQVAAATRALRAEHGPQRCAQAKRIASAIREAKSVDICIENFRANGEQFTNLVSAWMVAAQHVPTVLHARPPARLQLALRPILDSAGRLIFYVGVQFDLVSCIASLFVQRP